MGVGVGELMRQRHHRQILDRRASFRATRDRAPSCSDRAEDLPHDQHHVGLARVEARRQHTVMAQTIAPRPRLQQRIGTVLDEFEDLTRVLSRIRSLPGS
jgi:uncharacterized protein (DUF2336 family)